MARGAPTPRAKHPTNVGLSRGTLELCDWLIDGITLAANHPEFEQEAARIARARPRSRCLRMAPEH